MPLLSYSDGELTLNFSGDEITRVDVAIGELVTVTLKDVVDAFVRTFTLLIPKVRSPELRKWSLTLWASRPSTAASPSSRRPDQKGSCRPTALHGLHGIAQLVDF